MQKKGDQHNIYGTTIFIGQTVLQTFYGEMIAYTFQDLIHKGYVIALAHGDIHAPVLYTRMHSSCVTSELMRSLDCDCVQQLNGAIKKICEGNGILFYLIQQGRGCGYVGKSRACMTVQYYEQQKEINTFEAYDMMGMQHDYRQYTNVLDITNILKIKSQFILLTNNPDKIQKFSKLRLNLKGVQSIQVAPNPFNQTYLMSKQEYGHILYETKKKVQKYEMPYPRIAPFIPYSIPSCQRFVHVSSYYLPIKPVFNRIVITEQEYMKNCLETNNTYQIIRNPAKNNERAYYTQMTKQQIQTHPEVFTKPNWFQINVHYDIVTNQDYLVLKYGCPEINKVPVVRIHSESLFNRFPLIDRQYKQKYKTSMDMIIKNGYGFILIFYKDGRGSGLGYYILNSEEQQQIPILNSKLSQQEQQIKQIKIMNKIGVEEDKRDYFGAINLLGHYVGQSAIVDVACGETSFPILKKNLEKLRKFRVRNFIKIWEESRDKGLLGIDQRIRTLNFALEEINLKLDLNSLTAVIDSIKKGLQTHQNVYSTGIGSSEAHSKSLSALFNGRIKHINPLNLISLKNLPDYLLIVYSQGLSPNIVYCFKELNLSKIVFITSVDPSKSNQNPQKQKIVEEITASKSLVVQYPPECPDDTLIRITGPFVVYYLNSLIKKLQGSNPENCDTIKNEQLTLYKSLSYESLPLHDMNNLIERLAINRNLLICCDYPAIEYISNIKSKFIEGAMINTQVIDYVNFAHGTYQFLESQKQKYCIWFITKENTQLHQKTIQMLQRQSSELYTTFYNKNEIQFLPMKLQIQANFVVYQLIQILGVDQKNWPGKQRQKILYEVYN